MIRTSCKKCGNQLEAPDQAAGKRYRCQSCGEFLNIPSSPDISCSNFKKCPFCAEEIKKDAVLCKHCKSELRDTIEEEKSDVDGEQVKSKTVRSRKRIWIKILLVMFFGIFFSSVSPEYTLFAGIVLLLLCVLSRVPHLRFFKWSKARVFVYALIGIFLLFAGFSDIQQRKTYRITEDKVVTILEEAESAWESQKIALMRERLFEAMKILHSEELDEKHTSSLNVRIYNLLTKADNFELERLFEKAEDALHEGDIAEANINLSEAKKLRHAENKNRVVYLERQINNLTSVEHIQKMLIELSAEDFEKLKQKGEMPDQLVTDYEGLDKIAEEHAISQLNIVIEIREEKLREKEKRLLAEQQRELEEQKRQEEAERQFWAEQKGYQDSREEAIRLFTQRGVVKDVVYLEDPIESNGNQYHCCAVLVDVTFYAMESDMQEEVVKIFHDYYATEKQSRLIYVLLLDEHDEEKVGSYHQGQFVLEEGEIQNRLYSKGMELYEARDFENAGLIFKLLLEGRSRWEILRNNKLRVAREKLEIVKDELRRKAEAEALARLSPVERAIHETVGLKTNISEHPDRIIEQRTEWRNFYISLMADSGWRSVLPFRARDIMPKLFEATKADYIVLKLKRPMIDVRGHSFIGDILVIGMSRENYNSINWDAFDARNLPRVADSYWIREGL